jgi:RNA polymerase sigma factor (sigma-70 family)
MYRSHVDAVWGYVARRLGRDLASDVVAETFRIAIENLDQFDPKRGSQRAWIYGIATNQVRRHWRTESRRLRATARHASGQLPAQDEAQHVAERLDAADETERLHAAVGEPEHRSRTQRDQPTLERPGCVVAARITFDRSAPDQAQAWIDTAFATDFGEDDPIEGLLAAHFHTSDDGATMVNLAAWRSADGHRRIMQAAADAATAGADDPAQEIHTFAGIAATAVDRFRIAHQHAASS